MDGYLVFVLIVIVGSYLIDLIVELLNLRHISAILPDEFKETYNNERYKKSQLYLKENTITEIIYKTIFTIILLLFILSSGFNYLDKFARSFGMGPIITGLIFTGVLVFTCHVIEFPFDIYDTFVIENKYGFNKITVKTYILDMIKSAVIGIIIGGIIYSCILWFFGKFETFAWLYCWLAVVIFQLFLNFFAPVVIMPLFNKFIPLEDGDLKRSIENYALSQNFKMKGLFKMDGSKRSTKSNAYFTGFGKFRRIVLFDTLIEKHTIDELVSILAHEMGHYKKKHVYKTIFMGIITAGFLFFLLSLFINNPALFKAFNMENTSVYVSMVFFGFLYSPVMEIISLYGNHLSRKQEYEADAFAVNTGSKPEALVSALKKLCADNLSNLTPHPLMVFMKYTHPPVLKRIESIRKIIR
ncbi:MAG: M48 family metallopeptidase [Spirochaetota bacterium]